MKLSNAVEMSIEESRLFFEDMTILENGEGPRWKFDYSNFKNDPTPDILLLGAYQHPRTKNNLVGGINLHYLNKHQLENLAKALPQIMAAGNLYGRYHAGKRLVPDVFENSYRTYNASYIHGVTQDVLYPKYGFMKTASNWLKKKIGGIFKSKEQRQKEAQPQFPDDISGMKDRLDQVVQQLQHNPPKGVQPDTPEMQAARDAFLQFRRDQTKQGIERQENAPMEIATQDMENQQAIQQTQQQPKPVSRRQPQQQRQQPQQQPQQPQQQRQQPQQQPQPKASAKDFEKERQKNQRELLDPKNDINLEESIVYYSPSLGRYVAEPICNIIHSNW